MKFAATRKINLGNIDQILQYETEELGVSDCDSPEEAAQKLDLWVKDRILHYKEAVLQTKQVAVPPPLSTPQPAKQFSPGFQPPPGATVFPPAGGSGSTSLPPAEFQ